MPTSSWACLSALHAREDVGMAPGLTENHLARQEVLVIVSAPSSQSDSVPEVLPVRAGGRLSWRMRCGLVLFAVGFMAVLGIARWLKPTDEQGQPRLQGTHQQLGLPPCTFHFLTGIPCPACGLTTSFSHLAHGDVRNALRANPVGLPLAGACLIFASWFFGSAVTGNRWGIRDYEKFAVRSILSLYGLLFVVWIIRLVFSSGT